MFPYLEYIPDPAARMWNPCNRSKPFDSEVQTELSCLAKTHSLYLVANMGATLPCPPGDTSCPDDHRYQYNTNVVYAPNGDFIARYFKYNLNKEEFSYFDKPAVVNYTKFTTPFGTFATFCSNDILHEEPTVTLIKKMNITNIVFPSAWREQLPLMSAIEFHSAFAEGMLINLLAANLHIRTMGYYGSGLYWPTGVSINASYCYNDDVGSGGFLVVDKLTPFTIPSGRPIQSQHKKQHDLINRKLNSDIEMFSDEVNTNISRQISINGDLYTSVLITEDAGRTTVCQRTLCCTVMYEGGFSAYLYAFGAFDGLHTADDTYYLQACAFIKCANNSAESCGQPTKHAESYIDKMTMQGNFSAPYQYPEVLTIIDEEPSLVTEIWYFMAGSIIIDAGLSGETITVGIMARDYNKDPR
ncbi:pantetheinase-like isoform X2 [Dreissena polymorpha]|nr:pantetheinase-like isoform X2 [Dreissena polymorpha]